MVIASECLKFKCPYNVTLYKFPKNLVVDRTNVDK